jgi:hypothetical protein
VKDKICLREFGSVNAIGLDKAAGQLDRPAMSLGQIYDAGVRGRRDNPFLAAKPGKPIGLEVMRSHENESAC